jgi:hypothetical protein
MDAAMIHKSSGGSFMQGVLYIYFYSGDSFMQAVYLESVQQLQTSCTVYLESVQQLYASCTFVHLDSGSSFKQDVHTAASCICI